jgi:hypothetical protein
LGNENNCVKDDRSPKNFVFTFKNAQNIPLTRSAVKAEMNKWVIQWDPKRGACFGPSGVSDQCNAILESSTDLGDAPSNDIGLDGKMVFTSSFDFQVKEIQAFEIPQ